MMSKEVAETGDSSKNVYVCILFEKLVISSLQRVYIWYGVFVSTMGSVAISEGRSLKTRFFF